MSETDSSIKKCAKCKSILSVAVFSKNRYKADGLASECKACCKIENALRYQRSKPERQAQSAKYYRDNTAAIKEKSRKWEQENRERKNQLKAAYREKYREKIKEFSKRDWALHGDKRRARKKEYRAANPWVDAANTRNRQTRKAQAMPTWADPIKIGRIYKACARIAQVTGVKHHVDHYFPLKSDVVCGLHNEFNLRIITAFDNLSKGNAIPSGEILCQA